MPSVLLVGEDDAFPMYAEYLRHLTIDALVSGSPTDALARLEQSRPTVIVSELRFGGSLQAGCDFLDALRRNPTTNTAIVMVVSGDVRAEDAALARRCGADQFFRKPLMPDDLGVAVQTALRHLREGTRPEWNGPSGPVDRRKSPHPER